MSSLDEHYPTPCAFCKIATAYPPDASSPIPSNPDPEKIDPQCFLLLSTPHVLAFLDILPIAPGHILLATRKHYQKLSDLHNSPHSSGDGPEAHAAAAREEAREEARETSRALGEYLPLLSRALCQVTGIEDWNVVQNNGERAAQVVPHIHFHLIPRYQEGRRDVAGRKGKVDVGMLKSWTVFGRGAREDLDEVEAEEMARELRGVMRKELEGGRGVVGGKAKL
ncbi:hypothetical protein B0A54_10435 [Friedmanniomyces endolithicus]|uniref:HIT domain-containing protein n=1 Tax=Friedmanniomyces endolithicus TaxID=329885 RepID=A0A4U0UW84_9PEZI|nr:hypothetical protein LTS09_012502 [Friedmanniomyces endolithicus]TKA39416.1 hypothetical protein B0A54_10435 [Friedmanniomyces endolithicus]